MSKCFHRSTSYQPYTNVEKTMQLQYIDSKEVVFPSFLFVIKNINLFNIQINQWKCNGMNSQRKMQRNGLIIVGFGFIMRPCKLLIFYDDFLSLNGICVMIFPISGWIFVFKFTFYHYKDAYSGINVRKGPQLAKRFFLLIKSIKWL